MKLLCWFGIHPKWFEEGRHISDALIIDWIGSCHIRGAVHVVDKCPCCGVRWKSLLSPKGTKDFTERIK